MRLTKESGRANVCIGVCIGSLNYLFTCDYLTHSFRSLRGQPHVFMRSLALTSLPQLEKKHKIPKNPYLTPLSPA